MTRRTRLREIVQAPPGAGGRSQRPRVAARGRGEELDLALQLAVGGAAPRQLPSRARHARLGALPARRVRRRGARRSRPRSRASRTRRRSATGSGARCSRRATRRARRRCSSRRSPPAASPRRKTRAASSRSSAVSRLRCDGVDRGPVAARCFLRDRDRPRPTRMRMTVDLCVRRVNSAPKNMICAE
jgi:hypothetical protein